MLMGKLMRRNITTTTLSLWLIFRSNPAANAVKNKDPIK